MPTPSRVADLTIVTISTVGYGDIVPSTPALRAFTIFYILIGCGFVFVQLANVFAGVLEAFTDWVKRLIDIFDPTDKRVDTTGDGKQDSHVAGRSAGMSGKAHDLTGDGNTDFIEPPMAVVYWAQELLPAMLLLMRAPEFHTQLLPRASLGLAGPYTHAACGMRRGTAGIADRGCG